MERLQGAPGTPAAPGFRRSKNPLGSEPPAVSRRSLRADRGRDRPPLGRRGLMPSELAPARSRTLEQLAVATICSAVYLGRHQSVLFP